jgi:hypothetical protein
MRLAMYQDKRHKLRKRREIERELRKGLSKFSQVPNNAPEGLARHKDSYVVVKRTGAARKPKGEVTPREEKEFNHYLGYIKPGKNGRLRKFFPRSNNPKEDLWRGKIASKSKSEGE